MYLHVCNRVLNGLKFVRVNVACMRLFEDPNADLRYSLAAHQSRRNDMQCLDSYAVSITLCALGNWGYLGKKMSAVERTRGLGR